jgi:hypothetical protein
MLTVLIFRFVCIVLVHDCGPKTFRPTTEHYGQTNKSTVTSSHFFMTCLMKLSSSYSTQGRQTEALRIMDLPYVAWFMFHDKRSILHRPTYKCLVTQEFVSECCLKCAAFEHTNCTATLLGMRSICETSRRSSVQALQCAHV